LKEYYVIIKENWNIFYSFGLELGLQTQVFRARFNNGQYINQIKKKSNKR